MELQSLNQRPSLAEKKPLIDQQYRQKLADALKTHTFGTQIGEGQQFIVSRLEHGDPLLIKRLKPLDGIPEATGLTARQYFDQLKQQHTLFAHYFPDFVPSTEFIILGLDQAGVDNKTTDLSKVEYIAIQEEVKGEDLSVNLANPNTIPANKVTPSLKSNLETFIKQYRKMYKETGMIPENQIFVNFETGKLAIYDTNSPMQFRQIANLEDNTFLTRFNIDATTIKTSTDLLSTLISSIPELKQFQGIKYTELRDKLYLGSQLDSDIFAHLTKQFGISTALGYMDLLSSIDLFPPEGDNTFIRNVTKTFGLDLKEETLIQSESLDKAA